MPLHDKQALETQLAELAGEADAGNKATVERVARMFDGSDFPILSTENAFEKYWSKFDPFPIPIPIPGLLPPVELPAGPQERPSACDVYRQTFGRAAADCACRAYVEARREGLSEYQAIIVGHFAGRRAERTGVCPL
jgi:hypothetical protein